MRLLEVSKIIDLEPFQAGDGELFRFRLEILCEPGTQNFQGKVYRLETYRLQPTFPQTGGTLPGHQNDALILVVDEVIDVERLRGDSQGDVLKKFLVALKEIFAASISLDSDEQSR